MGGVFLVPLKPSIQGTHKITDPSAEDAPTSPAASCWNKFGLNNHTILSMKHVHHVLCVCVCVCASLLCIFSRICLQQERIDIPPATSLLALCLVNSQVRLSAVNICKRPRLESMQPTRSAAKLEGSQSRRSSRPPLERGLPKA